MIRILILLLLPLAAQAEDVYHVRFQEGLETVDIRACFSGAPPAYLYRAAQAGQFTSFIRHLDRDWPAGSRAERIRTRDLPPDSCLDWRIRLADAAAQRDYRLALSLGPGEGGSFLSLTDLWFWRDDERRPIRVEVELPPAYAISTPWKSIASDDNTLHFRPASTPAGWSSQTAVGRFAQRHVRTGGTQVRIATVGEFTARQSEQLFDWMEEVARSVAGVHGRFPQSQPQIMIVGVGRQREAVPWAHVIRGGGVGAQFYIDQNRPINEFYEDWTATHEISHLLLPYVSRQDRWLSEGLASYYQNVLRARTGRLSEQQAWQKLDEGFGRGRKATRGGSLSKATRNGRGATMRVYWSGAAIMLKADTELRAVSNGRQSLDSALGKLQACCNREGRVWRARELFEQLDRLTGYEVFGPLYDEHVPDDEFPSLESTYEQLGLQVKWGRVRIQEDAAWGRIRHFIMNDRESGLLRFPADTLLQQP